jgi:hypothetical protein
MKRFVAVSMAVLAALSCCVNLRAQDLASAQKENAPMAWPVNAVQVPSGTPLSKENGVGPR